MVAPLIHVAVGVIFNTDGKVLIAKRPLSAHQGGLWEFPGGKVDAGETVQQALRRELKEELAIEIHESTPLIQIRHHYPDKSVLLDVHIVPRFHGEPRGAEGQPILWVSPSELATFDFPAANKPIISAILLPSKYLITGAFSDPKGLISKLESAFQKGVGIIQLRIKNLDVGLHYEALANAISFAKQRSIPLIMNCGPDVFAEICSLFPAAEIGLHLNQEQASAISKRPIPECYWLGISCHNDNEIAHALIVGADYLLLSPVKTTTTHPEAVPLGWDKFKSLAELANVPVYALGGLGNDDLDVAKACGAQGIAAISAWWS